MFQKFVPNIWHKFAIWFKFQIPEKTCTRKHDTRSRNLHKFPVPVSGTGILIMCHLYYWVWNLRKNLWQGNEHYSVFIKVLDSLGVSKNNRIKRGYSGW